VNQLAVIEQPQLPAFTYSDIARMAGAFAQSGMFGVRDPNAALTLCLMAQAEGQHPASAFRDYSIVQGRPAKKSEAMLRDFIQSGGKVKWIELTDTVAKAEFSHPSGGSIVIDWTMERAKSAGLGTKDNWKKYPRQMLRSRVVSEGVRTVCPMATSGLYVPEEVQDFEPQAATAETIDANTGEIIEDGNRDPKIPGITKIRNNLNKLRRDGSKATELDAFNELVHGCRDDLQKIKDANHSLWTGMGEDFDGMKLWIKRRREELTPKEETLGFQFLCSAVQTSKSVDELRSLLDEHADAIAELDGEESRRFETLFNSHEETLKNPTHLTDKALVNG
jgi:hypothetical protein